MQLQIAKQLNRLLVFMLCVMLALLFAVYRLSGLYPERKWLFIVPFIVVGTVLFLFFKWLEANWDKAVINKMAQRGNIALVKIHVAKRVMPLRDSGFKSYWLYEFEGDLYHPKTHKPIKKTFYEKMSRDTEDIPPGFVYVTYDEAKPGQIFIIPNALISYIPELAPLIGRYENNKKILIKYLDTYYNEGMVVKTFRESLADEGTKKQNP